MKSIIFFETNKSGSSREGLNAAKKLGYKVHLLTSNKKFIEEKEDFFEVDEFHLVNFKELEQVREIVLTIMSKDTVACLISFIDSLVYLAARLSNELCGTNLSVNALKLMEDKVLTRNHLLHQPNTPFFEIYSKNELLNPFIKKVKSKLPLIVKLPNSCGSKNVYLVYTEAQLRNRIRFLRKHCDVDILIEEYMSGPQVIVEAIVFRGEIKIAAIIEQELTKSVKFIVTGYSISNELEDLYEKSLIKAAIEIIRLLGLENGNCHLEMRYVQSEWKLIEVNPRISGGVMNDLIQEAYGFNYAEQIIKCYLGMPPSLSITKEETVYAQYLTVDIFGRLEEVTGKQRAQDYEGILKVYIKPKKGKILTPPLSMGNRYGFVLAKGETKEGARMNALDAASQIQFHMVPL